METAKSMPIPYDPTMRAVVVASPGGADAMEIRTVETPAPAPSEVLVRVRAAALNRADLLQRDGIFPAPPGESSILGVEIAGDVVAAGAETDLVPGAAVFGLVGGGAYADYCRLDAGVATAIPPGLSYAAAAAMPEAYFTADTALFQLGRLSPGQSVLIHGGGSGIGSACIQLAKAAGARVACSVGSAAKAERARGIGADLAVNYVERDFVRAILDWTGGAGAAVVVDIVGADYFNRNLAVLGDRGCLVQVGVMSGTRCEFDLDEIMLKRLAIKATIMRSLPIAEKRRIAQRFRDNWLPRVIDGSLKPVVDSIFPLAEVRRAHRHMEDSRHFGKIVLDVAAAEDVPVPARAKAARYKTRELT
jgi:putative PIG3 family NAD(P)H quinone oxidoreductase